MSPRTNTTFFPSTRSEMFARFPAYVSLSRQTSFTGSRRETSIRTKFDPMKPAAPVTRRVCMGNVCFRLMESTGFVQNPLQVLRVIALPRLLNQPLEPRGFDEPLREGDLLDAGHLQPLPLFQRLHE